LGDGEVAVDPKDRRMHEQDEGERLLVELASAVRRRDPVPDWADDYARGAYAWRTIDDDLARLADLTRDSLLEDEPTTGVRGGPGVRELSFEVPGLAVELEVANLGRDGRRLVGQVIPPGPATVVVHQETGATETSADELGRFVVDGLRPGPLRLRCRVVDGVELLTPWETI
jgi:hypothetical protein